MVRVAGLKRHAASGRAGAGTRRAHGAETLAAVSERVHELVDAQHRCFLDEIQPLLAAEGIRSCAPKELDAEQQRFLDEYFRRTLLPVLTPLAVDPGHPFPYLGNRSLCLVVSIRPVDALAPAAQPRSPSSTSRARSLPRFVALPDAPGQHVFMLLEDVIRLHLPSLYNGYEVLSSHAIRVTRDASSTSRGAAPRICSPASRRACASAAWATAVRLQYDGGPARARSWPTLLDELELQRGGPVRGRGLHGLLGSVPALRGGRPAPAQGPAAAAAPGARLRERARHLERDPRRRRPRPSPVPALRRRHPLRARGRRRSRRCSPSR